MQNAFRTDIQALRGLAVSLVLLYHADIGSISGGYLGVDIFFVISGYLITSLVKKNVVNGTFSFSEFYFRRAKRLLPAAYVTILLTTFAAPFVLNAHELKDFTAQVIGAVTFTANGVLLMQSGYFQGAADLKPLLHVWSLSLEEQYYLLLPLFLVVVHRNWWPIGAVLLLFISLALCFALNTYKPIATFYLLPTRGWELGIGSLAAILDLRSPSIGYLTRFLFWPSVATLILVPAFPTDLPHPGLDALLVCLATIVIVIRQHPDIRSKAAVRALARVGDISYSLYLAHWPFFAFLKNAAVGPIGIRENLIALALGIAAAILLYKYIELPARSQQIKPTRQLVVGGLLASLSVMSIPVAMAAIPPSGPDYNYIRRANDGFSKACTFNDEEFSPKPECRNSEHPSIIVWGDSYAMHVVPGILATTDKGVIQATKGMCGPFSNLAPLSDTFYLEHWANSCLTFNRAVIDYIRETESIKTVVLSSVFRQYLTPFDGKHHWRNVRLSNDGKLSINENSVKAAAEAMITTIKQLRAIGKEVVIIGPTPSAGFNIGTCVERRNQGKLIIGSPTIDCSIPIALYEQQNATTKEMLKRIESSSNVRTISYDDVLCNKKSCATELDGHLIYVDVGHLTHEGSKLIFQKLGGVL